MLGFERDLGAQLQEGGLRAKGLTAIAAEAEKCTVCDPFTDQKPNGDSEQLPSVLRAGTTQLENDFHGLTGNQGLARTSGH